MTLDKHLVAEEMVVEFQLPSVALALPSAICFVPFTTRSATHSAVVTVFGTKTSVSRSPM
jgi:hypothetical protein